MTYRPADLTGLDPDPRYASPDAAADVFRHDEHGAGLLQPFVDVALGALLAIVVFAAGWIARGRSR